MPQWVSPHFPEYGFHSTVAAASDHVRCSEFARDLMLEGGNAVEAAITILICLGVVNPMGSGLGGGHFMTIYNGTTQKCSVVDARETAPLAATENMFDKFPNESQAGWRAIGVPGELFGMRTEYENFGGNVPWSRLFEPTIELMDKGVPVSQGLESALEIERATILKESTLHDFINPETNDIYAFGEIMRNRKMLRHTLWKLSESADPIKEFYSGKMARLMAREFKAHGGIITLEDFQNYGAILRNGSDVIKSELREHFICGPPPPSSSAITQSIIKIMDSYAPHFNESYSLSDVFHKFLEVSKYAYALRSHLGDPAFVEDAMELAKSVVQDSFVEYVREQMSEYAKKTETYGGKFAPLEDHGTSNLAVVDAYGNAVVVTTTINFLFGAGVASKSTGIIWNSNMDDFCLPKNSNFYGYPPAPANFIRPGKRPLSSVSPIVIFNKKTGKVEMAIGAAGGSRIISTVASMAYKVLFLKWNLMEAVNSPRLHNQLLPNVTVYEAHFPETILNDLMKKGHTFEKVLALSEATGIHIKGNEVYSMGDYRQGVESKPAGY